MATTDSVERTAQALLRRVRTRRRMSARAWRRAIAFYLFIAPWLLGFVLLTVFPLIVGFLTSLTNYDGLNLDSVKFVGLSNYGRVFEDADAAFSSERSVLWSALNTPIYICLSFLLALILNQNIKGQGVFRTIFFLPFVIPPVATVWVWKLFLDGNNGLLNGIISLFRPGTAIQWLSIHGLPSLTAIAVWGGLGFGMVVFLAGLQDIPSELEEAARIDGANGWQVFRYVTLPLMTPVIFFMLILSLIGSLQELTRPLLLASTAQAAVPPRSAYLYMIHTYSQIFDYQRFGYGTALMWLLIILTIALAALVFWSQRYWVHYEVSVEGAGK